MSGRETPPDLTSVTWWRIFGFGWPPQLTAEVYGGPLDGLQIKVERQRAGTAQPCPGLVPPGDKT